MPLSSIAVLRSVELPTVEPGRQRDLFICGDRILAITEPKEVLHCSFVGEETDGDAFIGLPGLVDPHVHILGGGGGAGYRSYVDGCYPRDLFQAGITSVVGSLGLDSTVRSLTSLVRKAKALAADGLGVRILVGGFNYPPLTVTGDLRTDMIVLSEVVGAGELALGDPRGSSLTDSEISNYASSCLTGGMLSGKPGILQIHLGDDPAVLDRIADVVDRAKFPPAPLHLTHVNRSPELLRAAASFGKRGGLVDVTTPLPGYPLIPAEEAVFTLLELGVAHDRITVSTDGFGGVKTERESRIEYVPSPVTGLLQCGLGLVERGLSMELAWHFISTNAAYHFGMPDRGVLEPGAAADILLFCRDTMDLSGVFLAGKRVM